MNILTFDIEEWALAKDGGYGTPELYDKYDRCLEKIFELLELYNIKATFFCTGAMAVAYPDILNQISTKGYEIGCHSYNHIWLNRMTYNECKEDISSAIKSLEDCIGKKVTSFRAPAFSIGEENLWVFDILAENGITTDSSIFPSKRDFGGFPSFQVKSPCQIQHNGILIKEFPIGLVRFLGKDLAYSGGGYFRFLPLIYIQHCIDESSYTMSYFHVNDFIKNRNRLYTRDEIETFYKIPGSLKNRCVRYLKSTIGKENMWTKLSSILCANVFSDISNADSVIDWSSVPKINL